MEEIIEVRDGAKVASVVLPGSAADGTAKRVVICKTMTISQWMSGCPEGGERQSSRGGVMRLRLSLFDRRAGSPVPDLQHALGGTDGVLRSRLYTKVQEEG